MIDFLWIVKLNYYTTIPNMPKWQKIFINVNLWQIKNRNGQDSLNGLNPVMIGIYLSPFEGSFFV